jgi:hypothetical protein
MKYFIFILSLLIFIKNSSAQNIQSYDICVYGATSAGVIAAYTAKKQGKSVILLEASSHIGGLSSGGLGQTDIGNKYAITGLSRDFYRRIGAHYGKFEKWTFEPSVSSKIFNEYLKEVNISVLVQHTLQKVKKSKSTITQIEVLDKNSKRLIVKAKYFIDCTYEGDLMAKAGISYTVGRESNSQYNETWNGVQLLDKHQFPDGIDPFNIKGDTTSGLLWGISPEKLGEIGSGDKKVQAYNFRMCLTDSLENQIPITQPENYDHNRYELLLRYIEKKQPHELNWALMHIQPMPHRKLDINNSGPFSTNLIGGNYDYPDADYSTRNEIQKAHEDHIKGFFYFLGNDTRVPEHLRIEMKKWGYPKDEYVKNNHFSPQMYVREARRMVSDVVMTEKHCIGEETVSDGIGLAAYTMDSHNTQRIVVKDASGKYHVKNEGDVQMGLGGLNPYPISYRAIIPKKTECNNLLVPVCLSASHIAFGSIRMEPVFMVLAQSAAMAACFALNTKKNLHEIDIKALQKSLMANPLANGSLAEILIDNGDSLNFKTIGKWEKVSKGYGRYGKDYVMANTEGESGKIQASFSTSIKNKALYKAYIYIPKTEGHVTSINVSVNIGGKISLSRLKIESEESDWFLIDTFLVLPNQKAEISIFTSEKGRLVADAVLWVAKK